MTHEAVVYEAVGGDDRLVVALSVATGAVELRAPGATQLLAGDGVLAGEQLRLPAVGWAVLAG